MHKQIETVKQLKGKLNNSNCLIIANLNEANLCSPTVMKKNIDMLKGISDSENLVYEIVNLSLLQVTVDGILFKSNFIRISTFLNSILAV